MAGPAWGLIYEGAHTARQVGNRGNRTKRQWGRFGGGFLSCTATRIHSCGEKWYGHLPASSPCPRFFGEKKRIIYHHENCPKPISRLHLKKVAVRKGNELSWIDKNTTVNPTSNLPLWYFPQKNRKRIAPGEARTHGLQIMRLTRCLLRYRGFVIEEGKTQDVTIAVPQESSWAHEISSFYLPFPIPSVGYFVILILFLGYFW